MSAFARLLTATGVTNLGDGLRLVALPLLATTLTGNPLLITGVVVADRLPWLLFLLPGGVLADRVDRLRLRVRLDWFRAAIGAGLALLVVDGHTTIPLLYLATVLMSAAEAVVDSSSTALVPSLVEDGGLESALARIGATEIVGRELAGPALGGILFAAAASIPFALDAATFAASAIVAATIDGSFRVGAERPRGVRDTTADMRRSIALGLSWLWREPLLRSLALLTSALTVAAFTLVSVLVIFATRDLGLGATGYGVLMIGSALGGLLGTWLAPRLRQVPLALAIGGAVTVTGLADVGIAATHSVVVVWLLLVLDTCGVLVWNVLTIAVRQRTIPDELRGRVGASYRFLLAVGAPVGAFLGGVAAGAIGARATILWSGCVTAALGALAIAVLSRPLSAPERKEPAMRHVFQ